MKNKMKILVSLILAVSMLATCVLTLSACVNPNDGKTYYDNEKDVLVFATQEVDKVFNPFYSTSATDGNVVGLTQIGMITNDTKGDPVWGDDEAVVVKDMQKAEHTTGTKVDSTTYTFVLKNNVRFSDGKYLTIKDVLFNLYVYLDSAYTGSSTIYSTDIVGLKKYRTQQASETEQENFEKQFEDSADGRIQNLLTAYNDVVRQDDSLKRNNDKLVAALTAYAKEHENDTDAPFANIVADYNKTLELFKQELQDDYNAIKNSDPQDTEFKNDKGVITKPFTTIVELFMYQEGYISWSKKANGGDGQLTYDIDLTALKALELSGNAEDKEKAVSGVIDIVFKDKIPGSVDQILNYWATGENLKAELAAKYKSDFFQNSANIRFPNIEGIKFLNFDKECEVNGVKYPKVEYGEDGAAKTNEVLSITINGVDPKAIWNFSFAVAPMHYYSDQPFDYAKNQFGVIRGNKDFFDNVVRQKHIGVPVGAGPYAASKSSGGISNIAPGEFYDKGIIYYERNPFYVMGPAKIKSVRYQVVPQNQSLNSLYSGEIHYSEPNAKPETITELEGKAKDGFGYKTVKTAGYGYIGINAGKVPSIYIRRAIMYAINTQDVVKYYGTEAEAIYRPMSTENWAYPNGATAYYPYIGGPVPENLAVVDRDYADYVKKLNKKAGDKFTEQEQVAFIDSLIKKAGYTLGGDGLFVNSNLKVNGQNSKLDYEFTIAGNETDHPAYSAMTHASELLTKAGFKISVKPRQDTLSQLASGGLAIWAAAWGSTIDPDMYQVYHKDSTATSVLNWGYKQILKTERYPVEKPLVVELSRHIDLARKTNNKQERIDEYKIALDLVMQLAVELPTYQRKDLFAYNANRIDVNSFNKDVSSYKGLTSDLHNLSLVVNMEK